MCLLATGTAVSQQTRHIRDPFGGIGGRAMAMAEAYSSEPHDVGSMYGNPAALAFLEQPALLVDYVRRPETRSTGYAVAVPLIVSRNQAFGLGFTYNRVSEPSEYKAFFPDEYGMDIASATTLAYAVSVGVRAGMRFGHSDYGQAFVGFLSLGAVYAPSPMISYSFVYNGMSLGTQYSADESVPMDLEPLRRNFEIGLTMRYPSARHERVVTISLANQKIVGQDGLLYKGGIEINPVGLISLRTGYIIGPNAAGARYGLGINTRWVQINYAVIPRSIHPPTHRISALIIL